MILPALPELPTSFDAADSVKQHLISVKRSLENACREIEAQIQLLDQLQRTDDREPAVETVPGLENLFSAPPSVSCFQQEPPAVKKAETRMVMEAPAPLTLDPELEQATLGELNEALSKAFLQMAGRPKW